MRTFNIVGVIVSLILANAANVRCAETSETQTQVTSELISQATALGELLRQDVEEVRTAPGDITYVDLPVMERRDSPSLKGAVVPIVLESRNAGNTTHMYIALYLLMSPDEEFLRDMGGAGNTHKHVALLGMRQIDQAKWLLVDWEARKVVYSTILVPACRDIPPAASRCSADEAGEVIIQLDGNAFGPNLNVYQ